MVKKKSLFFIDGFLFFGIAKALQQMSDLEIYAIIDTNKFVKPFYETQNWCSFNDVWYYRDHVNLDSKEIDLNYLVSVEEKYGIDLWKLALSDRHFYNYNEYYDFSQDQILKILELNCKFYEKILLEIKPDYLIMQFPDYNQKTLLIELCRSLNIQPIILGIAKLGKRLIFSSSSDKIDNFDDLVAKYPDNDKTLDELQKIVFDYHEDQKTVSKRWRSSSFDKFKASLTYIFKVCNGNYRKYYHNFGRTRFKIIWNELILIIKKTIRTNYINNHSITEISRKPFVYFPLNFQPEQSTLIISPYYENQLYVLECLARSIPVDYTIYVKEHPLQIINGWRSTSFYKKILSIPNVKLLHTSVSQLDIIKSSSLVVTVSGTAALEASFLGKPSIVFADLIFNNIPSIFKIDSMESLLLIVKKSLNVKIDNKFLTQYVNCIIDNSFLFDYVEFNVKMHDRFYFKGHMFDVYHPNDEIISFLDDYENQFSLLAKECMKKIT